MAEEAVDLPGDRTTPECQNAAECQVGFAVVVAVAAQVAFPEPSKLRAVPGIPGTFKNFVVRRPFGFIGRDR